MNDYLNFTIKEFNQFLNEKMIQEEKIALKKIAQDQSPSKNASKLLPTIKFSMARIAMMELPT